MARLAGFSKAELELLECYKELVEAGYSEELDRKAAIRLGLAESTIRSRKSRLRSKYRENLDWMRRYRGWQQYFFQKTGGKFNPLGVSGKKGRK